MCCPRDEEVQKRFLAKMKQEGRTWFWGWKYVWEDGESYYTFYRYSPGVHTATISKGGYQVNFPTGIHVYRRPWKGNGPRVSKELRVKCRVGDIVRMSKLGTSMHEGQIVLTRIQILVKDWKAASLPMPKPKPKPKREREAKVR